ncbi:MAG: hypothetical protein LHV68_09915 [Elusimicrobia bacterium]|nr:hypothetical protein [Candidatus Liberimonas magnetica]
MVENNETEAGTHCEYHPSVKLDEACECPECEAEIMEFGRWIEKGKSQAYFTERVRSLAERMGATMPTRLKVVRVENKLYFFDERLKELRNIYDPFDRIVLNDFEVEHYRNAKGINLNEEEYSKKLGKILEKIHRKA